MFGDWPAHPSVVEAIFGEQRAINELLAAIGRPRLFSEEFNAGDPPRGLQPFLLPTREEMERFTLQLDQVRSENLDARFFAGEVDTYEDISIGGDHIQRVQKRTIRLLREWLEKRYPTQPELVALITKPMAEVRELRQRPAHRLSVNEIDLTVWDERARLLGDVHAGLRALRGQLQTEPAANSIELPPWLEDEVRTY